MKKSSFFFFLALLCGSLPLYSQLQPKTIFAAGDWALISDLDRYAAQDYNARAGILLDENLTLGGFANRQRYDRFSDGGPDVTLQYQGLFTRYFFQGNGKVAPFLSGEVFFGNRDFNSDIDELNFNRNLWGWRFGAGADWFLGPTAAIEGQAGVQWFDEEDVDARTNILADVGLFFFLPPEGESLGRANPPMATGMLMIGGRGSFRWEVSESDTGADPVIAILPVFGYQFHPRWMIGGEFRFTSGQQETGGGVILDESDLTVALYPFLRLYLNPDDKFKVFTEGMAGAGFHRNNFNNEYPFRLRGSAGLDFFLSSNMAVEFFLGYQGVKGLNSDLDWEDGLTGGLSLRAFVGK
ncbi:MAG: hypothetical protein J5I94_17945 [Phaeodactylibacter sp.]|nr:hypothetical protein [Phaeodactylibacter sp.]